MNICAGALLPLFSMLQGSDTDLQSSAADAVLHMVKNESSSSDVIIAAGICAVGVSPCAEPYCRLLNYWLHHLAADASAAVCRGPVRQHASLSAAFQQVCMAMPLRVLRAG